MRKNVCFFYSSSKIAIKTSFEAFFCTSFEFHACSPSHNECSPSHTLSRIRTYYCYSSTIRIVLLYMLYVDELLWDRKNAIYAYSCAGLSLKRKLRMNSNKDKSSFERDFSLCFFLLGFWFIGKSHNFFISSFISWY